MTAQTFPVIDLKATGQNIHRLRIERGLSVRDIQQWFHFDQPRAIYKWQNGETLPSVDNLYALSVLLNVSMNDILVTNVKQTSCSGSRLFVCEPAFFNEIGRQRSRRIYSFAGIKALTKSTLSDCQKRSQERPFSDIL